VRVRVHVRSALALMIVVGTVLGAVAAFLATGSAASTLATRPARPARSARSPSTAEPGTVASNSEVLAAVRRAEHITSVPADLRPPLTDSDDIEVLDKGGACPDHYSWPHVGIDALHFGECTYGDPDGKKLMVVTGDSHAGMWFTALKGVASRTGWRLRIFYLPGCPAPMMTFFSTETETPNLECNAFRRDAISAIRALHPSMTIVSSATLAQPISRTQNATASMWRAGLAKTLKALSEPGTELVVIGDIPVLAENDAICLAARMDDVKACMTPLSTAEQGVLVGAERAASQAAGAKYIPTAQWECATECVPIVGSMRVYNDQFHLSATYANYLSGALQQALGLGMP
jgi:hypothetical protein